jgi:hypothetical protein
VTLGSPNQVLAPQVRLVDVSSGRIIGTNVQRDPTQRGADGRTVTHRGSITTTTSPDLVSARVTLKNDGISDFEVVLNNQRFDPTNVNRPTFPPWKYNDFSVQAQHQDSTGTYVVTFGQRVRLDVRYAEGPWTKMIVGRVTALAFMFTTDGGATIKVTGEDLLSALKVVPRANYTFPHPVSEREILINTLARAQLGISYVPDGGEGIPPFSEPLRHVTHSKDTTFHDFLTEIAARLDCELYVDFQHRQVAPVAVRGAATQDSEEHPYDSAQISLSSELAVRMARSRARTQPTRRDEDWLGADDGNDHGRYMELRWGRDLIDFTPTFTVWELPTGANASGSHPHRRGRVTAELTSDDLRAALVAELWPSTDRYPGMTPTDAITARHDFFGEQHESDVNTSSKPSSHLDQERARQRALANALKELRKFLAVEARTLGVPKLRPGIHVHITGLRPPFDGFYYVTQAVHELSEQGYGTTLSLSRPGMLPPDRYLTAWNEAPRSPS